MPSTISRSRGDEALSASSQLVRAAGAGDLRTAKDLLDAGVASVDGCHQLRYRPLMMAATMGHVRMAKLLIERGANLGATCAHASLDPKFAEDETIYPQPSHFAAQNGEVGVLRVLLETGADPDAINGCSRARSAEHGMPPAGRNKGCGHERGHTEGRRGRHRTGRHWLHSPARSCGWRACGHHRPALGTLPELSEPLRRRQYSNASLCGDDGGSGQGSPSLAGCRGEEQGGN